MVWTIKSNRLYPIASHDLSPHPKGRGGKSLRF